MTDTVKIRLTGEEWGEWGLSRRGLVVDAVQVKDNHYKIVTPGEGLGGYDVFIAPFTDDDPDDGYDAEGQADWAGQLVEDERPLVIEESPLLEVPSFEDQLLAAYNAAKEELEEHERTVAAFRWEHAEVFATQEKLHRRGQNLDAVMDEIESATYRLGLIPDPYENEEVPF